ncbi:HPr kinase/phosphorylase [Sphingomonas sp. IW22]|uniref:HPr kinase/phosphorylase n=1 Tax=Sphingomonas sp. IW22 TaxID=3242489 RepID=UPI003522070A
MTAPEYELCHATCVAIGGHAVLIEGRSGAGKSDLALRLIDRGATLVSDDQTLLHHRDGLLLASAPATIRGRMEVRGLGIVAMPWIDDVPVALVVRSETEPERMPLEHRTRPIAGVQLPCVGLAALESSAPIKVELALARVIGDTEPA